MKAKTYFAKRSMSEDVETLMYAIQHGKFPLKRRLGDFFRRVRCFFIGHDMVRQRWGGIGPDGHRQEYHIGCKRCPHFKVSETYHIEFEAVDI